LLAWYNFDGSRALVDIVIPDLELELDGQLGEQRELAVFFGDLVLYSSQLVL